MIKQTLWYGVAVAFVVVNVLGLGYAVGMGDGAHAALHVVLGLAGVYWVRSRRSARGEPRLTPVQEQIEQQAGAIDDVRASVASLSAEVAELQERVDFAERLLAQARERPLPK